MVLPDVFKDYLTAVPPLLLEDLEASLEDVVPLNLLYAEVLGLLYYHHCLFLCLFKPVGFGLLPEFLLGFACFLGELAIAVLLSV